MDKNEEKGNNKAKSKSQQDYIKNAQKAYKNAQEAIKKGDWGSYGRYMDELYENLKKLSK